MSQQTEHSFVECDQCGLKQSEWELPLVEGASCPRHYLDDDSCDGLIVRREQTEHDHDDQDHGGTSLTADATVSAVQQGQLPHDVLLNVDHYTCKGCGCKWSLDGPPKCPECARYAHEPSHLDVESPLFERGSRPHIWIQWKGTDVCCDIHCVCGAHCHFDGDFFYEFQCPHCLRYWEVGTHVPLYQVSKKHFEKRGCAQIVDPDEDRPVGSHGTQPLSEASGSAQSEAQKEPSHNVPLPPQTGTVDFFREEK